MSRLEDIIQKLRPDTAELPRQTTATTNPATSKGESRLDGIMRKLTSDVNESTVNQL